MKKINIVKKNIDFDRIIKKRNVNTSKYYILNNEINSDNIPKFGITFIKHIGNAITRNKLKRRTKSIIDNNNFIYHNSKNYIIIIKKEAINATYKELEIDLVNLFLKIKEENK